jgi:Regulator of chromosome condensation (RCC1) repeat
VAVVGIGAGGVLTGVTSLAGSFQGFCAVLSPGGVDCWGWGANGQLGDGAEADSATPVQVVAPGGVGHLDGVAAVVGGQSSLGGDYCAALVAGGVDCWGMGANGALGDGTTVDSAVPVPVVGVGGIGLLAGVATVTSDGSNAFCARLTSGGVDCWGPDALGDGTTGQSAVPVAVRAVSGDGDLGAVSGVQGFGDAFCALVGVGGLDCWGNSTWLGDGTTSGSTLPVPVEGVGGSGALTGAVDTTSGTASPGALLTGGTVACWGPGTEGQLGDGVFSGTADGGGALAPVAVVAPLP